MKLLRLTAVAALTFAFTVPPAHAVSKEIIQLQTQVSELQQLVQRLQSTTDSRFGVIQHLIEQTSDNMNQVTQAVNSLQKHIQDANDGSGQKLDTVSGQVQSLHDSVDELKSRLAKIEKEIQDLQAQPPAQAAPATGAPADPNAPGGAAAAAPMTNSAPPLQSLYQGALRDYNAGKYELAVSEFGDVIKYYPQDNLAGNASFYLGEVAFRQGKYKDAIKAYDSVLEQFAGNNKAPTSQLHKGESYLLLNQNDAGIREFRALIQRYPQTPEAQQARSRLNGMGVRITPAGKPTAAKVR